MFVKTFWDVALQSWDRLHLVVLRRDPVRILKSFMDLGFFHPRNPSWPLWMSDPVGPNRAVEPLWEAEGRPGPGQVGGPDSAERSIAYLVDIEGRIEVIRAVVAGERGIGGDHPRAPLAGVRLLHTSLDGLLEPEGRRRLGEFLGLDGADLPVPAPENTREAWKSYFREGEVSDADAAHRIDDYRRRADAAGVALPKAVLAW